MHNLWCYVCLLLFTTRVHTSTLKEVYQMVIRRHSTYLGNALKEDGDNIILGDIKSPKKLKVTSLKLYEGIDERPWLQVGWSDGDTAYGFIDLKVFWDELVTLQGIHQYASFAKRLQGKRYKKIEFDESNAVLVAKVNDGQYLLNLNTFRAYMLDKENVYKPLPLNARLGPDVNVDKVEPRLARIYDKDGYAKAVSAVGVEQSVTPEAASSKVSPSIGELGRKGLGLVKSALGAFSSESPMPPKGASMQLPKEEPHVLDPINPDRGNDDQCTLTLKQDSIEYKVTIKTEQFSRYVHFLSTNKSDWEKKESGVLILRTPYHPYRPIKLSKMTNGSTEELPLESHILDAELRTNNGVDSLILFIKPAIRLPNQPK